jgi:hypothetical protein
MGTIKLKDAIKGKKTVEIVKKPELRATVCDCCGKIYHMGGSLDDGRRIAGKLHGIFNNSAWGDDGRGLGNMFSSSVCSFKCADEIMNGGWKKIKEYKPYVRAKAELYRCELLITTEVLTEEDLVNEWEKMREKNY